MVTAYDVKVKNGRVLIRSTASSKRTRQAHEPHPLAGTPKREEGPIRDLGLSTTVMTPDHPRYSTSEDLLEIGLKHASDNLV